ncbi:MAG: hypothetical protein RL653_4240 [Pseudomonadota bacterium]|jgi:hypothetical protein
MPTRNDSGLSPRTLREYAAVLHVGLVDGGLNAERVATWSASRRSVLRSAMKWKGLTGITVPPAPRRRRVALPVPTDVELERVQRAAEQLPQGGGALSFCCPSSSAFVLTGSLTGPSK